MLPRKYLSALPNAIELVSGMPSRKPREIRARGRPGESERAARVLLRQDIELLPPEVAAEGDVMRAVIPENRSH